MWTADDTAREAAYQTLAVVDWAETRTIAANPNMWHEHNPIIGLHPSLSSVNKYFVFTGMAHAVIAYILSPTYRKVFETSTITLEVGAVGNNMTLGIGMKF
jgi:hypothetical protein